MKNYPTCEECGEKFNSTKGLSNHARLVHADTRMRICGVVVEPADTRNQRFHCPYCEYQASKAHLRKHMEAEHHVSPQGDPRRKRPAPEAAAPEPAPDARTTVAGLLPAPPETKQPMVVGIPYQVLEDRVQCPFCEKQPTSRGALYFHLRTKHPEKCPPKDPSQIRAGQARRRKERERMAIRRGRAATNGHHVQVDVMPPAAKTGSDIQAALELVKIQRSAALKTYDSVISSIEELLHVVR